MLGKVGSLQNLPAPSATVLNEALKLLATFGDSKSLSKLLEQVKEVQANNEQVFRATQEAMSALSVSQAALEATKQEFAYHGLKENAALDRRAVDLSQSEARLSGRITQFNQEQRVAKAKITEAQESIALAEQNIGRREIDCANTEARLTERETAIKRAEAALSVRQDNLQAREQKLRAALDG